MVARGRAKFQVWGVYMTSKYTFLSLFTSHLLFIFVHFEHSFMVCAKLRILFVGLILWKNEELWR